MSILPTNIKAGLYQMKIEMIVPSPCVVSNVRALPMIKQIVKVARLTSVVVNMA
jgi:hypothetical protein